MLSSLFKKVLCLLLYWSIDVVQAQEFDIKTDVIITTDYGVKLSAVVVRPKHQPQPLPTILQFTIYTDLQDHLKTAKKAAAHGYVGVVADVRGKRLSPGPITPYEYDAIDVNAVIDWISKQTFSDGRVAMYGGSYLGFSQWAATKYMHPALKTIVPSVANLPMQGLPMENNIFITPNIQWPFYVTNNKTLDNDVNHRNYWQDAVQKWFNSGRPYREIDKIEGTPNPLLQKWLQHPSQDDYWLDMGPRDEEFAHIDIPVLSINGYYDDGHISALYYLEQHLKHKPDAAHYWLIGPYNHFFSQRPDINGYIKDPVAALDRTELAFSWFDYILRGGQKPALLKDKVNYQLMEHNSWQHAASMAELNQKYRRYYLSTENYQGQKLLSETKPLNKKALRQTVDLADRKQANNTDSYYWPVIKQELKDQSGFRYLSPPFAQDTSVHGSFSGELKVRINKKDFDYGLTFYEVKASGKLFQLSYTIGRASYAKDPTRRQLLTPGKIENIPFSNIRMTGKWFKKGSRLLVVANVNKNPSAQINYGTGKDVSDERSSDGNEPLQLEWYNHSFINIPMSPMGKNSTSE